MVDESKDPKAAGMRMTIPQTAAMVLAGVYISGFLVINAHLSERGIVDFELGSSRYLIAGGLFFAFLVFWYLFPGHAVIVATKDLTRKLDLSASSALVRISSISVLFARFCFLTCLSATFFSAVVLGNQGIWFSKYVVPFFLFAYLGGSLGLDLRFPRASRGIELVALALGILVFFITAINHDPHALRVFGHFLLISLYICLVLISWEHFKITNSKLAYDVLYSAVMVLLFSSLFGALHYGRISSAYGGGQPRTAVIMIDDQTARDGLAKMGFEVTPFLKAQLVHENQQEFIVDVDGQTIRLSRKTVAGLKMLPEDDQ